MTTMAELRAILDDTRGFSARQRLVVFLRRRGWGVELLARLSWAFR